MNDETSKLAPQVICVPLGIQVGHHDDDESDPIFCWRMVAENADIRAIILATTDTEARSALNQKFAKINGEPIIWAVEEVLPFMTVPYLVCSVVEGEFRVPGTSDGIKERH